MSEVEMRYYSAALDEIFRLRSLMAYEAEVLKVHLEYKGFPKSRRIVAQESIRRLYAGAHGYINTALFEIAAWSQSEVRKRSGMSETLTRDEWEAEVDGQDG